MIKWILLAFALSGCAAPSDTDPATYRHLERCDHQQIDDRLRVEQEYLHCARKN